MNTKVLVSAAAGAFIQLAVLAGLPLLGYFIYQGRRHHRSFSEILKRAGLQRCPGRYLVYSTAFALAGLVLAVFWPPPLEPLTRRGSMYRDFAGLGLTMPAIVAAILYGAVQTGLTEEILFRGLIAGSLARRLSIAWANLAQAVIHFLPHCLILLVAPEMWGLLPLVFAVILFFGWVRIKSGSIIGPWLMHSAGNVAMALTVAIRTAA
jgi:membrane protease YdiL (CAAX protease family)